ncbi:hypothetical protein [Actinoplanes aureus]|uniref:Uncharacterized protein n=1 Tax=Actinoplanes aureus TaxID=2792083 RepID=A0A931FVF7_9ACTN|nr:hypothetical protein [Actinoplanes aureus]MBG0560742.1 hypothetical protein [Actinoplanes aureus]
MGNDTKPGAHDHRVIYYMIAAIVAVIAGVSMGLLSYAGGINPPLAVAAGLTATGTTICWLVQLIHREG